MCLDFETIALFCLVFIAAPSLFVVVLIFALVEVSMRRKLK